MTRFAGGPSESPGFLLWHATLRWQRVITAALAPLKLTHVQFVVLACAWWLGERGGTPNQQEVAAQAGTDVKMTSQVLRRLERRGLVTRRVDAGDTRARIVAVTTAGRSLAIEAVSRVEEADAAFFRAFPSSFVEGLQGAAIDFGAEPAARPDAHHEKLPG